MTQCIAQNQIRISARVVRDLAGFQQLRKPWNELNATGRYRAPFFSWSWYDVWWRHFGQDGELFIIVAEDEAGNTHGIAPLMRTRSHIRGLPVREIRFLDNAIGPRNSLLFSSGVPECDSIEAIVRYLAHHRGEWDIITLTNIAEQGLLVRYLRDSIARSGLRCIQGTGRRSPYISLEGSFDKYMAAQFNSKQRNNIMRRVRKLAATDDCELRDVSDADHIDRALEMAFRVSEVSWKGERGTHMSASQSGKRFYAEITDVLARRGEVRIRLLTVAGKPVAVQYQLTAARTVYLLVNDYDESYQPLSPGIVLLYRVIEKLHAEGAWEFDFCGDLYDYKMQWATGLHSHVNVEVFSGKFYSLILYLTKSKFLPALRRTKEWMSRWRAGSR